MSSVQSWLADFSARHQQLPGAKLPWLAAMRQRAMDRYAAEGWPTTKKEDWRHTSLALLEQANFNTQPQAVDASDIVRTLRADEDGHWLVFVDGRYEPALSEPGSLPAGVRLGTLADALAHEADLVQQAFGSETDGNSTAALNLGLASDGAFVYLARGAALEKPVHVVFVASGENVAVFPR